MPRPTPSDVSSTSERKQMPPTPTMFDESQRQTYCTASYKIRARLCSTRRRNLTQFPYFRVTWSIRTADMW